MVEAAFNLRPAAKWPVECVNFLDPSTVAKALKYKVYYFRSLLFSENTKKAYRTHRDSFLRFCLHMGYSLFPATSDIVCQYAAFLARTFKVSSVRNFCIL